MIFLRTFDGMLPMQLGVSKELQVFLFSCMIGACLGLLYQLLRAARVIFPHFKWAVFSEDMLFGIFCGFCYFLIFTGLKLSMRGFIAFAMAVSGVLVHLTVGSWFISGLSVIDRKIKDKLLRPLLGFIAKKAMSARGRFVQKYKKYPFCKKIIKNRLKQGRPLVYNKKVSKHNEGV